MIKIANRQIFIFFFDFLKKNMGPSNMGNPVHIDHFGPVKIKNGQNKHVLLAVDGFSKFVKLWN